MAFFLPKIETTFIGILNFKCMKLLFFTLLFFICFTGVGQKNIASSGISNYIISGKVYDSTLKQNLAWVSILCRNKYETTSGYDGSFHLKLPENYSKKNFSILVSCIGYKTTKIKIKNRHSPLSKDLLVYLKQNLTDMNEVITIQ